MAAKVGQVIVDFLLNTAKFETDLKKASKSFKNVGREFTEAGKTLTAGLTLPIAAAGAAFLKIAGDFDEAMDKIRAGTGATGATLEGLGASMRTVLGTVPSSIENVSTAISTLNTRLGLTGRPLEEMSAQILNLSRMTGTEIGGMVASSTRLFGDWSVATGDQSKALDYLFKVSQQTGIGIQRLMDTTVQYGAPLRALGFDLESAAVAMGKWEKEGVNMETVLTGLKKGLGTFAKAGVAPAEALTAIEKAIKGAKTESEAMTIAIKVFGQKAGPDLARAILEGRMSLEDLKASIKGSGETINKAAQDTMSFGEKMQLMVNRLALAAEPLGNALLKAFDKLFPYFEKIIDFIAKIADSFSKLPTPMQAAIIALGAMAAAAGPLLMVIGSISKGIVALLPILGSLSGVVGGVIKAFGSLSILGAVKSFGDLKAAASLLIGEMGLLGKSFLLAGAFMVGWEIGKILNNFKIVQEAGDLLARTLLKIPGLAPDVNGAINSLGSTTQKLADRLKSVGVNVDRLAGESIPAWSDRVNAAAAAHLNLKPKVDGVSSAVGKAGKAVNATSINIDQFTGSVKKNSDALESAERSLDRWWKAHLAAAEAAEESVRILNESIWEISGTIHGAVQKGVDDFEDLAKKASDRSPYDAFNAIVDKSTKAGIGSWESFSAGTGAATEKVRGLASKMGTEISTTFTNMAQRLADNIIEWKGWGETLKSTMKDLAKGLLSTMIESFLKPLMDAASGVLKNIVGGIANFFTGGGTSGFSLSKIFSGVGGAGILSGLFGGTAAAATLSTGAIAGASAALPGLGAVSVMSPELLASLGIGGGVAAGGAAAAGGGAAAAGGAGAAAGGGGLMSSLAAFATNPITIAAAAAGVMAYLGVKFATGKNAWEAGGMEAARDFGGIQVSSDAFEAWTKNLGLSEEKAYPIRKDLLSSPVALQWLAGLAEQQGMMGAFLNATENITTAWGTFNFRDELEKGLKTGIWDDLNASYKEAFGTSKALLQAIPDISDLFLETSDAAKEAAAESKDAVDAGEKQATTTEKLIESLDWLTKAVKDLPGQLESLYQNLPARGQLNRETGMALEGNRTSNVAVRTGDMPLTFNVYSSDGADLERTIKTRIIPILNREARGGNTALREAIRFAYDRTRGAY